MDSENLKRWLGQRLSVGFEGYEIPDDFRQLVKEYKVGNVILFRRNVKSYEQLSKLNQSLTDLILSETNVKPFIMMDEECGSVSRLAGITFPTPCAMAIGATENAENAHTIGRIIGEQLLSAGVNFNLAPVLDVMSNRDNHVIGNRSFGFDPLSVSEMACAYLDGLQSTGVFACGKHFPGHGDTSVDSHVGLPLIDKPKALIEQIELVPFRAAIKAGVKAIMSAHCIFPAYEPERKPATVSRLVMTDLLKTKLDFKGITVSDGMEMQAVMDLYGINDGVLRALNAGIDIALVCHSPKQASEAIEYCLQAIRDERMDQTELRLHYDHILAEKQKLPATDGYDREAFANDNQRQSAERIMEQAVTICHTPLEQPLPFVDDETWFYGSKARRASFANDQTELDAAAYLAASFGGHFTENGSELLASDIKTCVMILKANDPELQGRIQIANALAEKGGSVVAVSMSLPFLLDQLSGKCWKICAYQYDELALKALEKMLHKCRSCR